MSLQSFDELAAKITRKIQNQNSRMRLSIPPLEMLAVTINVYCPVGCHVLKDVQFPLRFEGKVRSNCIGQVICDSFALQEVCGYCPTVLHTPEVVYGFCVTLTFITSNDQIGENRRVCTGPKGGLCRRVKLEPKTIRRGLLTFPGNANGRFCPYPSGPSCTKTPNSVGRTV
ncbi:hypothetical protein AVEN_140511-1 [Araneus ventricosus]|uniref:Uncharacterized protein n=1 Tax=Araneus ventricosus TaxID=182803 RepID=A0A4Y2X7B7_ARAVE|nr:hypothetical protein AVEN_140511-1 [Araneus ventricosus]